MAEDFDIEALLEAPYNVSNYLEKLKFLFICNIFTCFVNN